MTNTNTGEQASKQLQPTALTQAQAGNRKPALRSALAAGQMLVFALILLAGLMALVQSGEQPAFSGGLPVLGLLQNTLLVVVFLGICSLVLFSPVVFLLHYLRRGRQGAIVVSHSSQCSQCTKI